MVSCRSESLSLLLCIADGLGTFLDPLLLVKLYAPVLKTTVYTPNEC